ncbi:molybdenum ABC transporter ATP-binding protein [Sunxiuqinia indica]|uniref:molybdenum ABC transporter ATP-binding protein n=1 Tax=Sunxiuqinia indica TaxID=2692584 RepID=UPI0013572AA5|nr:molybdenum ABC transporter ATP-binding protein [Sunxiuqinia indica]
MSRPVYVDIKYRRGNFLLQMKDFIPEGIVGIFGPSGSGKSSLLKILAGIEFPDDGQIIIRGHEFYNRSCKIKVPARKRKVGLVFQEGRLFPHMTVRKNLLYGHDSDSSISLKEVVDLLEIDHLLDKKPDQCSGGEKQRIAIGRMLLNSPEVLMLDEPFSALDQRLRRNIIPYLIKIHEKYRLPIWVVSHDIADLLMLTSQLIIISNGRILGSGNYYDLLFDSVVGPILQQEEEINSVRLKAQSIDVVNGMTAFYYYSDYSSNYLMVDVEEQLVPDDQLIISIAPQNISLSLDRVDAISTRNQLQGAITSINRVGKKVFCMVNIGFPVLVEITSSSMERMNLEEGKQVFCLIKSSSIKILSIGK